jgi:hypothetical protein
MSGWSPDEQPIQAGCFTLEQRKSLAEERVDL